MKKFIAIIFTLTLILSICAVSAFAENKSDKPAFEKIGIDSRTLNLTENNGKTIPFITGGNPDITKSVECTLTAEWIKPFDPNVGYSQDAPQFYTPDGLFVDNVKFTGGADVLKNVDGYEWRGIRVVFAQTGNCYWINTFEDYYTLQQYDVANSKNILARETTENGYIEYGEFTIDYQGTVFDKCYMYLDSTEDTSTKSYIYNVFYRIPEGYDGCIFSFVDTRDGKVLEDGMYNSDVPRGAGDVYFRLK